MEDKSCSGQLQGPGMQSWWQFPICIKLRTRQFLPKNDGIVRQGVKIRIKEWAPKNPASHNFYRCPSTSTIQQTWGEIRRKKLKFVYIIYCSTKTLVLLVSLTGKKCRCNIFFSFFRSHKCGNICMFSCIYALSNYGFYMMEKSESIK